MVAWFRQRPGTPFFVLTFGLTWLVWVPRATTHQGLLSADWAVTVGAGWSWIPALAAILIAIITGARTAVWDLAARLGRWRVGWPSSWAGLPPSPSP